MGFSVTFSSDKRRRDSPLINKKEIEYEADDCKKQLEQTGWHPSTLSLRLHAILKGQCTEVRIGGHGLCAEKHTGL